MVAADGSRGSDAALKFAADLVSRRSAAALTVITVAAARGSEDEASSRRRAQACLALAGRTLRRSGIAADLELVDASPLESIPEAIQRASERFDASLVVIGSEGRDTLREWVVGGVALRLLYLATRPVAVVRPPRRARRPAPVPLAPAIPVPAAKIDTNASVRPPSRREIKKATKKA